MLKGRRSILMRTLILICVLGLLFTAVPALAEETSTPSQTETTTGSSEATQEDSHHNTQPDSQTGEQQAAQQDVQQDNQQNNQQTNQQNPQPDNQGNQQDQSVSEDVYGNQHQHKMHGAKDKLENRQEKLEDKIADFQAKLEDAVMNGRYVEALVMLRKLRELQGLEEAVQKKIQLGEELVAAIQAKDYEKAEQLLLQILTLEKNRKGLYKMLGKLWRERHHERHQAGMPEKVRVFVEGQPLSFGDVEPSLINGRTMIPLRKVANALGIANDKVKWDETNRTVTIENNGTIINLQVDSKMARLGNRTITLDVPPQVVNGRTLVPLRFISEALGKQVEWYPEGSIVAVGEQ